MDIDPEMLKKLFIVPVTAIVVRDGKFLIMKRAEWEKAFPGKWTVPGGKFEEGDFIEKPLTTKSYEGWYDVVRPAVGREVREEAGIEIEDIRYLTDYTFKHPKGFWVLGLSFWAQYVSGEVRLPPELTEYAWVTVEEAKDFDLIEGIYKELVLVNQLVQPGV